VIVVFEKTFEFIEKASVEELQAELEKYGIEFIPNPAKGLKVFACQPRFSFSSAELVFASDVDLLRPCFANEYLQFRSYHVEIEEQIVHSLRKDAA